MTRNVLTLLTVVLVLAGISGCRTSQPPGAAEETSAPELAKAEALYQKGDYTAAMIECVDLARANPDLAGLEDLQHDIMKDTVGTLAYVGAKGTHLVWQRNINQLHPLAPSANPFHAGQPLTDAECGTVKPYHVEVQAFRVNRVATNPAGHSADRLGNRLLYQWFGSLLSSSRGFMCGALTFRPFTARRRPPGISRIESASPPLSHRRTSPSTSLRTGPLSLCDAAWHWASQSAGAAGIAARFARGPASS